MNDNVSGDCSAFSSEAVLSRLAGARNCASKEANRLFLISIGFAGLYLIKASGLHVDLTMLDTDVGKVPHGLFFFLVASQISIVLCYMRTADSVSLDSRLREGIEKFAPLDKELADSSYPNEFEWFSETEVEFTAKATSTFARFFYSLTSFLTAPTAIVLYVLPSACGIYAIFNWEIQITTGNVDLQYWIIVAATGLSILWFFNYVVVHFSLRRS